MYVLKSRKVWASALAAATALACYAAGAIDAETLVAAVIVAAGIFTGSVAVEDGLAAVVRTKRRLAPVIYPPIEETQRTALHRAQK